MLGQVLASIGRLRNDHAARSAARTTSIALKKKDAPGMIAGAFGPMKYPKIAVVRGGPTKPATLCRLVSEPWTPPCSSSPEEREMSPRMAGAAMPELE